MASKKKVFAAPRSNNEIRALMLRYFYERNAKATSARGKQGYAVKISAVRKELKAAHQLQQNDVIANLNYLISQGWIAEEQVAKSVPLPSGTVIPQATSYYKITAAGIDKIEGPSEFTMDKFKGVKIESTGQNIITVGDGNQVDARFGDAAGALVEFKQAVLKSTSLSEARSHRRYGQHAEPIGKAHSQPLSSDSCLGGFEETRHNCWARGQVRAARYAHWTAPMSSETNSHSDLPNIEIGTFLAPSSVNRFVARSCVVPVPR